MTEQSPPQPSSVNGPPHVRTCTVLTPDEQLALTPEAVLEDLRAGNERFVAGDVTVRDHLAQLPLAETGQNPEAIVLSCVDSRVPVENIFDQGIGDLFVARVAGNFVNADMLGSMEYACKVAGAMVVLVLGHQHCGAIKSAIDGVELGNITELLSKITPVVDATDGFDDRTSANPDFVAAVTRANVAHTIDRIRAESPILAEMETTGEIAIVGAVYTLATGEVAFLTG